MASFGTRAPGSFKRLLGGAMRPLIQCYTIARPYHNPPIRVSRNDPVTGSRTIQHHWTLVTRATDRHGRVDCDAGGVTVEPDGIDLQVRHVTMVIGKPLNLSCRQEHQDEPAGMR